MFKTNAAGLIVDASEERPVGTFADSFVTALGAGAQADIVIMRLYHRDWPRTGPLVPREQVHQFALPAHLAAELAHRLLALAAQAEKELQQPPAH